MEKLIVCGIPSQFLSASAANPVSKLSHIHPLLTMEGAGGELQGQEDTAQQGLRPINRFVGQDTGQCTGSFLHCLSGCACVSPFGPNMIFQLYIIQYSSLRHPLRNESQNISTK